MGRYSIKASLAWLFLSILIFSGIPYFIIFYDILFPPPPFISQIIQLSSGRDLLKTYFLAELLDLSCDKAETIYTFDLDKAEKALLACPLIKTAHLSFLTPESLIVEYELRNPVAFLGGWQHIAADKDGHLFPFYPFFSPKNLPIVYLEAENTHSPLTWNTILESQSWQKALELLKEAQLLFPALVLESLDLSAVKEKSPGRREMVIQFFSYETNYRWIIRLNPSDWSYSLKQLLDISKMIMNQSYVIDLRIKDIAMITPLLLHQQPSTD